MSVENKANLRDLIAATGLLILLKFDPNHRFSSPCDLKIWCMISKNNRAPLLYYIKLCVSVQIHRWIQTEVTLWKHSIRAKSAIFCPLWPWNLIDDLGKQLGTSSILQALSIISNPSVNWNWSYSPETLNLGQNGRFFVLCDLEILWMTLENNRAPLLYYIELCASFQIHQWIQIGVIVRKRSIWVKIGIFLSRVTLKCDRWPWKTIGHLFCVASSFVHHFTASSKFKLELQSGNAQSGSNSTIFKAVRPWNLTDDLGKQ